MMEWVVVPVALIILVGEYSAVLWLPALAASIWLVVKEPRSRKVLLPLAGGLPGVHAYPVGRAQARGGL